MAYEEGRNTSLTEQHDVDDDDITHPETSVTPQVVGLLKTPQVFVEAYSALFYFKPRFGSDMDKPKCWFKNVM